MSEFQAGDISVLIIDDQRAMRSIVRQLLSQIGIRYPIGQKIAGTHHLGHGLAPCHGYQTDAE